MKTMVYILTTVSGILLILVFQNFYYDTSYIKSKKEAVYIPVLSYHSIEKTSTNRYTVNEKTFLQQMNELKNQGYESLTLEEFDAIMKGSKEQNGKKILITFDDGYEDNYTIAYPILKQIKYTAALFAITSFTGNDYVSWEQLLELHEEGWDIMSHTVTHPHLPLLKAENQEDEMGKSKKSIEKIIGSPAVAIAYPFGHRNKQTVQIAKNLGYRYGFTFDNGIASNRQNPYLLKRLFITDEDNGKSIINRIKEGIRNVY